MDNRTHFIVSRRPSPFPLHIGTLAQMKEWQLRLKERGIKSAIFKKTPKAITKALEYWQREEE